MEGVFLTLAGEVIFGSEKRGIAANVCITESTNIQRYFPQKIVLFIINALCHFCEVHIEKFIFRKYSFLSL